MFQANPCNNTRLALEKCKQGFEALYEEKAEGIILRARARWHEHGEKNSKYFLNLEQRNHFKKHVRKLHISGVISTDPFMIMESQRTFYMNLYRSRNVNLDNAESWIFFDNPNLPRISYIGEAARSILDIMDYTKTYDIPGLLLFIDFEKAFDSLDWNFMFKCLEVFGFGPSLTR